MFRIKLAASKYAGEKTWADGFAAVRRDNGPAAVGVT
jgi:hypothetical protein